jgi:hypothetical protein
VVADPPPVRRLTPGRDKAPLTVSPSRRGGARGASQCDRPKAGDQVTDDERMSMLREIVFAVLISVTAVAISGIVVWAAFLALTSRWD